MAAGLRPCCRYVAAWSANHRPIGDVRCGLTLGKPSNPKRWNSGFAFLSTPERFERQVLDKPESVETLLNVLATYWMWEYFKSVRDIRVCDAIALHFYLDPRVLGMSGETPYAICLR